MSDITETGAGDLGLVVRDMHTDVITGGVGFRIGTEQIIREDVFVPELTALITQDFAGNHHAGVTTFIGDPAGAFAFVSDSTAARTSVQVGLGVNVHKKNGGVFSVKYNGEVRSKYTSHAAFLRYYYDLG